MAAGELDDDGPVFDEAFIAGAPYAEATAEERVRRAGRIARDHKQAAGWRGPVAPASGRGSTRAPKRRDRRSVVAAVVAVAVVATYGLYQVGVLGAGKETANGPGQPVAQATDQLLLESTSAPNEPAQATPARILPAVTPPAGQGGFAVLDEATRWDPCRAIHYLTNPANAAPGGTAAVTAAFVELSRVTGLAFIDDGTTGERPSDGRPAYQPQQYGEVWAPVLVAWSDPAESPSLAADVLAFAGSNRFRPAGKPARYVSGEVVIDAPQIRQVLSSRGQGTVVLQEALAHELGHLVGLSHVVDDSQVMNPTLKKPRATYGQGDLRGLATVGAGGCR